MGTFKLYVHGVEVDGGSFEPGIPRIEAENVEEAIEKARPLVEKMKQETVICCFELDLVQQDGTSELVYSSKCAAIRE